jgi:hypothetical protein
MDGCTNINIQPSVFVYISYGNAGIPFACAPYPGFFGYIFKF